MSFSFSSLIRLIVVMALGTTMLAVGLSKLDPPRPARRSQQTDRYANINEYYLNVLDRTPRWLDSETGKVEAFPLDDGDILEAASCSPWADEKGDRQMVGRWSSRTKDGPMSMSIDFGLGRYTLPGGQMLDHVSTDIVPVGSPCWFPGTRAQVLFAAGDGNLYRHAFEPEAGTKGPGADDGPGGDAGPSLVAWRCRRPGVGKVFLSDPTWPEDPRMGGRVVVSLREQTPDAEGLRTFTKTALWWLKLNHAGTEVVEAGRLLVPDADESPVGLADERSPTVGTLPDGRLAVAYLDHGPAGVGWELRVAPIELVGDHHVPKGAASDSWLISSSCMPSTPVFSADGRWLNAIADDGGTKGRIVRFSIAKLAGPSR